MAITIATVTTFAVPVVAIMWVTHSGPFNGSSASISFCSTLNTMTNYAVTHPTPKTAAEIESSISYSSKMLTNAKSIPSDIQGTVNAALSTSNSLLVILQTATANGGWATGQQQQAINLDGVFTKEASTMNKWYQSNC